ncbi:MAG: glycosyltransferase family 4 protein [Rhodospirillaceae bacterium]
MATVYTAPLHDHSAAPDPPGRLRVSIVTETYPPEVNGVAMTVGRMVHGLIERGHAVQVVRPRQQPDEQPKLHAGYEEMLVRGVPIPCYDMLKLGIASGEALRARWMGQPPDIVHIVTEGPLGWVALRAARGLGIPVSSDFHTNFHHYSAHYRAGWLRQPILGYLKRFHNRVQCTMVPTEGMREELLGLGFRNLEVVARGVDTSLFDPARHSAALRRAWGVTHDDPVVLSVGRLAPEKNLPLLFEAFQAMREREPRARLVVVGDGPSRAAFERLHPEARFAGIRTGEDLAAHYASANVFLFPSLTETYGNVTVEAMASGLAVVAYDYAAAAMHIRHERNGIAVPPGNSSEFVRLAAALVSDRARVARLGMHARATAEQIDWPQVAADFERTLARLVHQPEHHEPTPCLSA